MEVLRDRYNRTIEYMRISITDRCNLRCRYCMPHGIRQVPMSDILTYDEILQVVRAAAKIGIRYIKITGGEPLVRKNCVHLIREIKAVPGIEKVTLTTNGILLSEHLDELLAAGLDAVNISLDTLDREQYQALTGFDELETVKRAILACCERGVQVKVNAVSLPDVDIFPLVEIARNHPVDVRFIEMMPIGYGKDYGNGGGHADLLAKLRETYGELETDSASHGFGPAVYYHIPGFAGSIGLISALHGKFCDTCNRVRLTSMGYLKTCLCYEDGVDLRAIIRRDRQAEMLPPDERAKKSMVRAEETEKFLQEAMRNAIYEKPRAHCFERPEEITEEKEMASIGG